MDEVARQKWNQRWGASTPAFMAHPLLDAALAVAPGPAGAALEVASGPSGIALALAERGWLVTAVDISEVALAQLDAEAARRGLGARVRTLAADVGEWRPPPGAFALVLGLHFWDAGAFAAAAAAVAPGGVLAWETFTLAERRYRPGFSERFCLGEAEPRLPPGFVELARADLEDGRSATRRLLARRQ